MGSGHPVFVYNTVKLSNIHEKHGLSPTMTIFCRVNTPRKNAAFWDICTFACHQNPVLWSKKWKKCFLFWAWNEKSCKWGFLPLINHFTHVAWQPSLSLSLDVSMQPVAPRSIIWKFSFLYKETTDVQKNPPLLRISISLIVPRKALVFVCMMTSKNKIS